MSTTETTATALFSVPSGLAFSSVGDVVNSRSTETKNQFGTISRYSTKYDFCGRPVKTQEGHAAGTTPPMYKTTTYVYDIRGRVVSETMLKDYNLGRLSTVTYNNGVSETRTYTVQGWLKEIEARKSDGTSIFKETMRYWDNGTASSLYSGMIAGTDVINGSKTLDYDYTYDYL